MKQAARCLVAGGLVAYPTEAVYGIGCDPWNEAAVDAIRRLKQRTAAQGFIVIAAAFEQLQPLLAPLPEETRRLMTSTWPGPVTWVAPGGELAPPWLSAADGTLAVRVTAHPLAGALCRAFAAPLVSTSANRRGGRPARTGLQARCRFPGELDYVLHGPTGGSRRPSEIRDARTHEVLRPGD